MPDNLVVTKIKYAVTAALLGAALGWIADLGKEYTTGELEDWRHQPKYEFRLRSVAAFAQCVSAHPHVAGVEAYFEFLGPGRLHAFLFRPAEVDGWNLIATSTLPPERFSYLSGNLKEVADDVTGQSLWRLSDMSPKGAVRYRFCYGSNGDGPFPLASLRIRIRPLEAEATVDDKRIELRDVQTFPWWVSRFGTLMAIAVAFAILIVVLFSITVLREARRGVDPTGGPRNED